MSEIELHQELSTEMEYARAVSAASILPTAYRDKPADVLVAVGLGRAMGLTPAESLYRIDVIQGKPTASAELIAANVRRAGHKLRLRVDEQAVSATCTIIRADDPDYEHTVVRDAAWAKQMGLASKDNYKKQPATMLGWRAVTACARMACPEALYGVAYTGDEMRDMPREPGETPRSGLAAVLVEQVQTPHPAPTDAEGGPGADQVDDGGGYQTAGEAVGVTAAVVSDDTEAGNQTETASPLLNPRSKLATEMIEAMQNAGIDKDLAPEFFTEAVGRPIKSSKELTEAEARRVLDHLPQQPDAEQ